MDTIQQKFNDAAGRYDLFSGMHQEIADKLLVQLSQGPASSTILDVGCGTGYLTIRLKDRFLQSKITGLDFSSGMLNVARAKHGGIDWVLADGHHLPFADGHFESVVSNLAYQWAGDLSQAFSEAWRVLVPKGILRCTLFGYNTCRELLQCLDEAGAGSLSFTRLPDEAQIRRALAASGFKNPEIDNQYLTLAFKDMFELMVWLKSIGANNLLQNGYLGRETISSASSIYQAKYSYLQGIAATFEVIRIYAEK